MSLHILLSCENMKCMKYSTNRIPWIRAVYVSLGLLIECVPCLGKFLCQFYGCSVWTPVSLKAKLSTVFSYMTFFPPKGSLIDQCAWQIAFNKWGSCLIFVIVVHRTVPSEILHVANSSIDKRCILFLQVLFWHSWKPHKCELTYWEVLFLFTVWGVGTQQLF